MYEKHKLGKGENINAKILVRDAIIQAYAWVVWKGRNDEIFKGETFIPLKAANDLKFLVFMWVCNRCAFGKKLSWNDWCLMPMSF